MRRGGIVVGGDTGEFTGAFMIAGSILVLGSLGERAGAGMKRGSIITWHQPKLLPTFRYACTYHPTFLRLLLQELRWPQASRSAGEWMEGRYRRYSGDLTALGKGEILAWEGRMISVNRLAAAIVQELVDKADRLGVQVATLPGGARLSTSGSKHPAECKRASTWPKCAWAGWAR